MLRVKDGKVLRPSLRGFVMCNVANLMNEGWRCVGLEKCDEVYRNDLKALELKLLEKENDAEL